MIAVINTYLIYNGNSFNQNIRFQCALTARKMGNLAESEIKEEQYDMLYPSNKAQNCLNYVWIVVLSHQTHSFMATPN